jgi:rhodanese-related sulfurtransferase
MIKLELILFITLFFTSGLFSQNRSAEISVDELKNKMGNDDPDLLILDVRNPDELKGPLGKIDNVINIPIQYLEDRLDELKNYKDREIAVICRSGNRSYHGTVLLNSKGFKAKNVVGGMIEYRKKN